MIIAGTATFTSPSQAASSQWVDLGGGKARLVATLDPQSNKIQGAVEVHLEPGWSTYWRYPGSSGIPPRFDFSNSKAYAAGEVSFPAPKLVVQDYGTYAGYKNKVMFPFNGDMLSTTGGSINLDLLIGVCSEVCIPAKAEMSINASDLLQTDAQAIQTVSFARKSIPEHKKADDIILDVTETNDRYLNIKMRYKKNYGTPALFVEGPQEWYLTPAKLVSQTDDQVVFTLDTSRAPKDTNLAQTKLRYTLVSGISGIEVER